MLIWAIVAMSLDILMGYTEMTSFGHATYMGLSAYSTAILIHPLSSLLCRGHDFRCFICCFCSGSIPTLALRAKGHYFLLITMALGMVVGDLQIDGFP